MVYKWKQGFSVTDSESNETIRSAEMQLCLSENGINNKKQIRKLFEITDMDFFNLFAGEREKSDQQKDSGAEGTVTGDKKEPDVNRGWLT